MLKETIAQSIEAIQRKKALDKDAMSHRTYQKNLQSLCSTLRSLSDCLDSADAIHNSGICSASPIDAGIRSQILYALDNCANQLKVHNQETDAVKLLDNAVSSARSQMNSTWTAAANQYAGSTLGYLDLICDLTENPAEIRSILASIRQDITSKPSLRTVSHYTTAMNLARERQAAFQMDDAAKCFLERVQNHKATLADLTPDVLEWISQNRLAGRLKISF